MKAGNELEIVEAAYEWGDCHERWLSKVLDYSLPYLDRGYGLVGYLYNFANGDVRQGLETSAVLGPYGAELLSARNGIVSALPSHVASNATRFFCAGPTLFTVFEKLNSDFDTVEEIFKRYVSPWGLTDCLTVNSQATAHDGLMIHVPSKNTVTLTPALRKRWGMISAHLASGLRLRRMLQAAMAAGSSDERCEAVLSPDGQLRDASGSAKELSGREALRRFVMRLDAARAKAARSGGDAADEALSLWTGLVEGRWSVVDRFESDGRRYLVAYRNDCSLPDPRALNAREAQICLPLARGRTTKEIAYELGLHPTTIETYILSSCQKLGATSRIDLIQILCAVLTGSA